MKESLDLSVNPRKCGKQLINIQSNKSYLFSVSESKELFFSEFLDQASMETINNTLIQQSIIFLSFNASEEFYSIVLALETMGYLHRLQD